jgi:serine phosphatase RsbU (regulator of sigma subunit)
LVVRDLEGRTRVVPLDQDRISLGRSAQNVLSYPDDVGLSRQHLAITRKGDGWIVEDLGSKNGSLLNGDPLKTATPFKPGDRVAAGHLTIEFAGAERAADEKTVVFVESVAPLSQSATTVEANLEAVLGGPSDDLNKTHVMTGNPQTWALIRAGRELVGFRPLSELFDVILDLSIEAVLAGRGVLLTVEGERLQVRAARGDGFQISSTVRDRVIREKRSILVRDAQMDQNLREHQSIVQQKVRSILAVPLQTNERVIGLIYLDTPNHIREFNQDDLNLLTVMANIAATRIENARLTEIEAAERAMAMEMQQAAQIQMRLLPSAAPHADGADIAAKTVPARSVGGDYYDFIAFPDGRIGLMVGDVAGKGMPASLLMSSLQARVHVLFEESSDLGAKIERLNKATCGNCPDNRFITFFMGIFDPKTGELNYVSAGHNPPLIVRAGGGYDTLGGGGIILGILSMAKYEESHAKLEKGDVLVMFSDGVTEAPNPNDEEYGEERLANLVAELSSRPAQQIVDAIHASVHEFTEGAPPADDITVVVARRV